MKSYRIHVPYINGAGVYVSAGIYTEDQIDLGEARHKSILTLESSEITIETKPETDDIRIWEPVINDPTAVKEIKLEHGKQTIKVKQVKINSADFEEIDNIKYVSKKVAHKVIEERDSKRFSTYLELDERVPLGFNRKWEDIISIDFEYTPPTVTTNSYTVEPV